MLGLLRTFESRRHGGVSRQLGRWCDLCVLLHRRRCYVVGWKQQWNVKLSSRHRQVRDARCLLGRASPHDNSIQDINKSTMSETDAYIGQRLSLKSQTCTVRYVGQVADKQGQWLGVEWDDASRGKHDGTHEGVSYFKCRSLDILLTSLNPKTHDRL